MFQKMLSQKLMVVLAIVLLSLGSATYVGAHGGDTALIHACVTSSGAIRIVGANTVCTGKDNALDWNIQGPMGPQGEKGPQGTAGISGLEYVVAGSSLRTDSQLVVRADCPAGKKVLGGGYEYSTGGNNLNITILGSVPYGDGGWAVAGVTSDYPNPTSLPWWLEAFAICAYVAP